MNNEHGPYSGVVDIARNGIDEVIRLRALNAELVKALRQGVSAYNPAAALTPEWVHAARAALAKVEVSNG